MKYIICLVLLLVSTATFAGIESRDVGAVGFDKLTDSDKLTVMKDIADRAQLVVPAISTPEKVSAWVKVGTDIGAGLAGAARELGVQANEFVKTPVGEWVAFLIIWHFMGSMVIHVVAGGILLIVGIFTIRWYYRIICGVQRVYDPEKSDVFGRSMIVSETWPAMDQDYVPLMVMCSVGLLIAVCIVTFTW